MVTALGKIRGVGDLPTITIDAASNYGDKGVYEVADLIHRTTKADITQGRELLDKTTAGLSPERADRLHATVASLAMNDDPHVQNSGTESSHHYAGKSVGGDWDDGLSAYERNKRLFPGFDDQDKPNTFEILKRKVTDTNTSVKRDMPQYKSPDMPPPTPQGLINDYIHRLEIDPNVTDRIKPDDIETLKLMERFRQLDADGTKELEKRLGDLRERDPSLYKEFTLKRQSAENEPGKALWSLSDQELKSAIRKIEEDAPRNAAAKILRDAANAGGKAVRGRYPDPVPLVGKGVLEAMGMKQTEKNILTNPYWIELRRRKNWHDQR